MKKLLIGMIETILLSTGALKMSQPLKKNTQYNDLTVRYYLGMTMPKYNHLPIFWASLALNSKGPRNDFS